MFAGSPFHPAYAGAGQGEALPEQVLAFMEPRFGQDFGAVRVHRDARANELAEGLQAKAFTVGNAVFFRQGEFAPETAQGQRLIAHELAHVVQQRGLPQSGSVLQRQAAEPPRAPDAHFLARRIHAAFNIGGFLGLGGTDEDAVFDVLETALKHGLMSELKVIYSTEFPDEPGLEEELRDELSGDDLERALRLFRRGLAAVPAKAPASPPAEPVPAAPSRVAAPKLLDGTVTLKFKERILGDFTIQAFGTDLRSEFDVSVGARLEVDPSAGPRRFEYGLVQNVVFNRIEARYEKGR
jgi:hypothetical protein